MSYFLLPLRFNRINAYLIYLRVELKSRGVTWRVSWRLRSWDHWRDPKRQEVNTAVGHRVSIVTDAQRSGARERQDTFLEKTIPILTYTLCIAHFAQSVCYLWYSRHTDMFISHCVASSSDTEVISYICVSTHPTFVVRRQPLVRLPFVVEHPGEVAVRPIRPYGATRRPVAAASVDVDAAGGILATVGAPDDLGLVRARRHASPWFNARTSDVHVDESPTTPALLIERRQPRDANHRLDDLNRDVNEARERESGRLVVA